MKTKDDTININLKGSAGQSLGSFLAKGITLTVEVIATITLEKDYLEEKIVVKPSPASKLVSNQNTIIGNTVLYGATSGTLYASGQAGERFAVRNQEAIQ